MFKIENFIYLFIFSFFSFIELASKEEESLAVSTEEVFSLDGLKEKDELDLEEEEEEDEDDEDDDKDE